jgi:hypothetical protein
MWGLRLARFASHVDFGCAPGKTAPWTACCALVVEA